jgi:EpsI family protein
MSLDARPLVTWLPAVLLGVGVAATHNVRSDAGQPLRAPLVAGTYVQVNNYVLQRGSDRALVLYWYQGRGRIQANEYRVKIDLLRDAVLHRRTEEALVRVVVPLSDDTATQATALAERLASFVAQRLDAALPAWP